MTFLDYLVLIITVVSVVSGTAKGILKGAISIVSALAGLGAAAYAYRFAARVFGLFVSSGRLEELLGFVSVFAVIVVAGTLLAYGVRRRIKGTTAGLVDHLLGAGFGLVRAWLICSVIYLALTAFPARINAVERSLFAPVLLEGTKAIACLASAEVRDRFMNCYKRIEA
jgi:membrane protein required for colicin V production